MSHENDPYSTDSISPKSRKPANNTFTLVLLGFGGTLLLGVALVFLIPSSPTPPELKPLDPKLVAGTNDAPKVPVTPPFRANISQKSGALAAAEPSPLNKKSEVKPEKPAEKKDPDEEAVTLRFPNPLPTSAPLLSEANFATTTGTKGKLPPPDPKSPLQKRIPKKLVRPELVAPLAANGATGTAVTLGLKSLSRDEALLETGSVDALEAIYGEGDAIVEGYVQVVKRTVYRPPTPTIPMPRPKPAPGAPPAKPTNAPATPPSPGTPGTNDPSKVKLAPPGTPDPTASPAIKVPPLVPAWAKTSVPTSGFGIIRYRLLQVDEEAKAQMILSQWISRFAFANNRIERVKRTDGREIQLFIIDPCSATMGFTVIFWINGNVVNQIATFGKAGAKDLFLMLPY